MLDLESLDIKVEDEDKTIILLNSLPKSLKYFKETLKYGRDAITFDDIQNSLNAKVLDKVDVNLWNMGTYFGLKEMWMNIWDIYKSVIA